MLLHDYITIDLEINKSVLVYKNSEGNVGVVKDVGPGYYLESGEFVKVNDSIKPGDRVIFTQCLSLNIDGKDIYITRYRDVIEVLGAKV